MMALLFVLFIKSLISINWITEKDLTIAQINSKSVLKKKKEGIEEGSSFILEQYKLDDYNRLALSVGKGKYVDTLNYQLYSNREFVFARVDYIVADYLLNKGAYFIGKPVGEITERKVFFKDKTTGIVLKRTIDYSEISNMDSLKNVLNKKSFDTTWVGNEEYLKQESIYKRFKKRI